MSPTSYRTAPPRGKRLTVPCGSLNGQTRQLIPLRCDPRHRASACPTVRCAEPRPRVSKHVGIQQVGDRHFNCSDRRAPSRQTSGPTEATMAILQDTYPTTAAPDMLVRIRGEYNEMPGLRLTP